MSNTPLLPLDFITDVTNQTQMIAPKTNANPIAETSTITYKDKAEEFWAKRGMINYYNKGTLYTTTDIKLEEFLIEFRKILIEIIRTELIANEKTSEDFKDDFKILEHTYNNIIKKIKRTEIIPNSDRMFSTMHGFINHFVR